MQHRPPLPPSALASVASSHATPASAITGIERGSLFGVDTVRAVLERLSKGPDHASSAMSLLLVLRTFALEQGDGLVVELSSVDIGMLVTVENKSQDFWVAEMLPLTMGTVRKLLAEMPELLMAFEKVETSETLSLRVPAVGFDMTSRMTPIALPSIGLLLEAGLLSPRVRDVAKSETDEAV